MAKPSLVATEDAYRFSSKTGFSLVAWARARSCEGSEQLTGLGEGARGSIRSATKPTIKASKPPLTRTVAAAFRAFVNSARGAGATDFGCEELCGKTISEESNAARVRNRLDQAT